MASVAGNHDPAGPASVWDRIGRLGAQSSSTCCIPRNRSSWLAGALLSAGSFDPEAPVHDPTEGFGQQVTSQAAVRVGLAHVPYEIGSLRPRSSTI